MTIKLFAGPVFQLHFPRCNTSVSFVVETFLSHFDFQFKAYEIVKRRFLKGEKFTR